MLTTRCLAPAGYLALTLLAAAPAATLPATSVAT